MRGITITNLQELETLDGDEVAVVVIDPGGTPVNQKLLARKLLTRAQIMFTVPGTLSVDTDPCPWFLCSLPDGFQMISCIAAVKTAPTGTFISYGIHVSDDGASWTNVHANVIAVGDKMSSEDTDITPDTVTLNQIVKLVIGQVGTTVAGADLTVSLRLRPL